MLQKILTFFQKETVLSISAILAILSMFIVHPSGKYFSYIDFRTLSLLFCLMSIVAGLSEIGLFDYLAEKILSRANSIKSIIVLLVLLCFFFSMIITNDVALITFVPFAIIILKKMSEKQKNYWILRTVVMQTIAANLGSMLTPLGNPQNLYLYTISGLSLWDFIRIMLPYSAVSALLLILFLLVLPKVSFQAGNFSAVQTESSACSTDKPASSRSHRNPRILFAAYCILFLICLLTVLHILPFQIMLLIVFFGFLILDYHVLKDVDYFLLLTFFCFFLFIGNIKQIPFVHDLIAVLLVQHEVSIGIISSQIISNVPAAILLSGFTNNYSALLIGVNLGGLGTLIASLASLISFKFYANTDGSNKKRYLGIFTLYNAIFLVILFGLYRFFG